jgi:hypothetical protein
MFHIHTYVENASTVFTLFILFIYPPLLANTLHLNMTCFTFLSFTVLSIYSWFGGFTVNIWYFNQSDFLYYPSLSFFPILYCSPVFSVFCCIYTDAVYFNIIHSIILFFFPSSPSLS